MPEQILQQKGQLVAIESIDIVKKKKAKKDFRVWGSMAKVQSFQFDLSLCFP